MRLTVLFTAAALSCPFACLAQEEQEGLSVDAGEIVVVTQASRPASSTILPSKGMNKASVSAQYGQPAAKRPPVGGGSRAQPPITRWDYDGFSVFFEYDHVVDAVQRDHPAPIAVYDGLAGGPPR